MTQPRFQTLVLFSFILSGITVYAQSVDVAAERATLLQADKDWAAAAKAGDVQRIVTFWADDAINYYPGKPPAVGKQAIIELVKQNRSIPGFSLSWEPAHAEVAQSGELGYTSGSFQLSLNDAEGNPLQKHGNYVCIWKKATDGSWKCAVETSVFGPHTE